MIQKPVFYYSAHKAIWNYLYIYPDKNKMHAVLELGYGTSMFANNCPACESTLGYIDKYEDIEGQDFCNTFCPLKWNTKTCMSEKESLFLRYISAMQYDKASEIAAQIRDLPLVDNAYELYKII